MILLAEALIVVVSFGAGAAVYLCITRYRRDQKRKALERAARKWGARFEEGLERERSRHDL